MDDQKPILDYSSPAGDKHRAQTAVEKNRLTIERYHQSVLGKRRVVAAAFMRVAIAIIVAIALLWLLPDRLGATIASMVIIVIVVWERTMGGWRP